jgi:hypothetical protein
MSMMKFMKKWSSLGGTMVEGGKNQEGQPLVLQNWSRAMER